MTNKKLKILLEVIIMIGLTVYISMNNVIPELKRKFGSSDKLISYLNYSNMFEININNNTDFILVLNKKDVLPKSIKEEKLIAYFEKNNTFFEEIIVISVEKNLNIDYLLN